MKKNDSILLTVTDMNSLGYGVGHTVEGKAVFVNDGVPGDTVKGKIIKDGGSYFVLKTEEIITPSVHRILSPCAAFPRCGGCAFCHLDEEYEKKIKENFVRGFFLKAGLSDIEILPLLSVGRRYGYRNKVQYPYQNGVLGYYAPHSHRVVKNDGCLLHQSEMEPVLSDIEMFLNENAVPSYDEENGKGLLRHVCLRSSKEGKEMILTLVIAEDSFPYSEKLIAMIRKKHPSVVGVYLNINKKRNNVILGDRWQLIWGRPTMTDELLSCTFEMAPASFYQVNREGAELLYSEAIKCVDLHGGEKIADLFCGIGTIGICMAKAAPIASLVGIEVIPEAIENAKKNAERNGITNARFVCGDANHPALEEVDVVVVDPPRKGLDAALIEKLSALPLKKIVYVSCDPATLARDLVLFRENGFEIHPVRPVDLFPGTGHVECVCNLEKKKRSR